MRQFLLIIFLIIFSIIDVKTGKFYSKLSNQLFKN